MTGTSGDVIGRYERGGIMPSIDVVAKIADALEVSVDYLIGKTTMQLDKQAVKRLEDISKLPENNKISFSILLIWLLEILKLKKHMLCEIKKPPVLL